jgi:hypothetical protein
MLGVLVHQVCLFILTVDNATCFQFTAGYDNCRQLTGPDFMSVFNLQLWAGNAKMINFYMLYGYAPPSAPTLPN